MTIRYFYSILYFFYKDKLKEDDFFANYYTISVLGFLFALNGLTLSHIGLKINDFSINEIQYIFLGFMLWICIPGYFYLIDKNKIRLRIINKKDITKKWKIGFLLYFVFSKIIFFYTLILYAIR